MHYLICFELDNAESMGQLDLVSESFESVLASASAHDLDHPDSRGRVAVVFSDKLDTQMLRVLQTMQDSYPKLEFELIPNISGSYFGAKNTIVEHAGDSEVVIFCDSDCVYELEFVGKMLKSFSDLSQGVVFGETYPNLSKASSFNQRAALWWLFPPREIGYGTVWNNSHWFNNMAVKSSILRTEPFPEVSVCVDGEDEPRQIKVEGVLWTKRLVDRGIKFGNVMAISEHRIFDTWSEFNQRQFVQGLATAFMSAEDNHSTLYIVVSPLGEPVRKLVELSRQSLEGGVKFGHLVTSLPFFMSSLWWRLLGSIAFRNARVDVKRRGES